MKASRKTLLCLAALAAAAVLLASAWYFTRPQAEAGEKHVTVQVVHGDQSSKEFTYDTDLEYLGELLLSEGLAQGEEGAFGLYITTVDGETALDSQSQWWCITQDGQMTQSGADATPIRDGDHFELTLSTY